MKMQRININDIKKNADNPRVIKDEKYKKLIKSIKEFPKMLEIRPIVVDESMTILGGNMRYEACKEAGMESIPVIHVNCLSDEQKKEFIIKDNVAFGDWDWKALTSDWEVTDLNDWGVNVPMHLLENDIKDDDFEFDENKKTNIEEGDLIHIGQHKLYCGSSTELESWSLLMGDSKCDLVITDPPYNVNYEGVKSRKSEQRKKIKNDNLKSEEFYAFLHGFFEKLAVYTKKGAPWYVWHSEAESLNFRKAMLNSGINIKQCLIWAKNTQVIGRSDYHYKHEPCLYGWMSGQAHPWYGGRKETTILNFDKPQKSDAHFTMKPLELVGYLIKNSSKSGDLICDGFLGSGSTMISAHQIDRQCYGMEIEPEYCQFVIDRMLNLEPSLDIKVSKTR